MTKRQDLCLQRRSRPEQSDQRQPNQAANISHQPRASPNSTPLASWIEFPTMTTGQFPPNLHRLWRKNCGAQSRHGRPGSSGIIARSRAPRGRDQQDRQRRDRRRVISLPQAFACFTVLRPASNLRCHRFQSDDACRRTHRLRAIGQQRHHHRLQLLDLGAVGVVRLPGPRRALGLFFRQSQIRLWRLRRGNCSRPSALTLRTGDERRPS